MLSNNTISLIYSSSRLAPTMMTSHQCHLVSNNRPFDCVKQLMRTHTKTPKPVVMVFVRGIHRWPLNFPPKGSVTQNSFHLTTLSWQLFWQVLYLGYYRQNFMQNMQIQGGIWNVNHKMFAFQRICPIWIPIQNFVAFWINLSCHVHT